MDAIQQSIQPAIGYAFFDVDDTLISIKSMLSFQDFWYRRMEDSVGEARYQADLQQYMHEGACWSFLNRLYYRHFAGRKVRDVVRLGREWFQRERARPGFYHQPVVDELRAHQAAGRPVVFVSGSFPALLEPIAEELGVEYILSTQLEEVDGHYTGEILPPQTIGEGKAEAIGTLLCEGAVSASDCFAYGDDRSDLPMLNSVGCPVVVGGGRGLEERAREVGWPIIEPV